MGVPQGSVEIHWVFIGVCYISIGFYWGSSIRSLPKCSLQHVQQIIKSLLEMTPDPWLESCLCQLTDWLLTDSWLTPYRHTHIKLAIRLFGGDKVSIWRALQISSPNLVTITLLIDNWWNFNNFFKIHWAFIGLCYWVPLRSYIIRSQFGELSKSVFQMWLLSAP